MNRTVLMIMGGALAVAVLVAVIVQSKLSGGNDAAPSTEILVATKKLMLGEKIRPEDVRWQPWPESALFEGVIQRGQHKDEKKLFVYDTPLRRNLESGEPVTRQAVIADIKGAKNYLAAAIAPGMRAMAVKVKAETAVGGFLAPGNHVDVLMSYSVKMSGDIRDYASEVVQRYGSETILSNVKVLAVDQEAKNEGREAKPYKTVTLEVSREQAEKLALATQIGDIMLAMRRMGEEDTAADRAPMVTTDINSTYLGNKVVEVMKENQTNSNTVRVYSGTRIQNVPVRAVEP